METLDELIEALWNDYTNINKQAGAIFQLLTGRGEKVFNDHIAFRTYNLPKIGIEKIAQHFDLVRVDLYRRGDKIYVGELTHCHNQAHGRFETIEQEEAFSRILFG